MTKHSNICHVTYFDLIFCQNKYCIMDTVCLVTALAVMIVLQCELYQSTVNKQPAHKLNISFPMYTHNFIVKKYEYLKLKLIVYITSIISYPNCNRTSIYATTTN